MLFKSHSAHYLTLCKYTRVQLGEYPNSQERFFELSFAHGGQMIKYLQQCTHHHGQSHLRACRRFARNIAKYSTDEHITSQHEIDDSRREEFNLNTGDTNSTFKKNNK